MELFTKVMAAGAAMAIAASTASCGGRKISNDGSGGKRVAYSATSLGDAYRVVLANQVRSAAKSQHLNLLPTTDANNDPAKQITDVTTMLGQGVGGILMVVLDSKAIKPALDRAAAKKVPVVAIDQGPTAGKVAITVRGDTLLMGRQACEQLGERMNGKGAVLELQGALDGIGGQERSKGFNDCMKSKYPQITVVSKPTEWLQEKATTAAQTVLSTDRRVNGIYLASDSAMLPGVIEVLKRLGRLAPVGTGKHVPLVTVDGSPYGLNAVRAGHVDAVISQPLDGYAKWAAHYLARAMAGETFKPGPTDHDSTIVREGVNVADVLKAPIVTKQNVDQPNLWGNQAARGGGAEGRT
jgi:ABC-type sugar transport system substrate-binding protein